MNTGNSRPVSVPRRTMRLPRGRDPQPVTLPAFVSEVMAERAIGRPLGEPHSFDTIVLSDRARRACRPGSRCRRARTRWPRWQLAQADTAACGTHMIAIQARERAVTSAHAPRRFSRSRAADAGPTGGGLPSQDRAARLRGDDHSPMRARVGATVSVSERLAIVLGRRRSTGGSTSPPIRASKRRAPSRPIA